MKPTWLIGSLMASAWLVLGAAAPAMAQDTYTPRIDRAQQEIGARIEQGVESGRISEREARRLYRQERRIERDEARAKADGVVTRQERRQLRQELAALNNELERALGNGDDRRYVR